MCETSPKEIISKARQEILIKKKPAEAIDLLLKSAEVFNKESEYNNFYKETLAFAYQEKKEYAKAAELYKKLGCKYRQGFCELLQGNKFEAEKLWYDCPESPAVNWGRCLSDFINLRPNPRVPSYLQVRNFLETDIGYLIAANKIRYAENIIKNEDVFISVNLESYKLIGRVLLNHGFLNMSKKYLIKSINIVDRDAETFFHLGQLNYAAGSYKECITVLNKCIELNPDYIPAESLLEKVRLKTALH